MLKAVIFDIDDTLYDYKAANLRTLPIVGEYAADLLDVDPEQFLSVYQEVMERQFAEHSDTAGCHSRTIRFQLVLERLGLPLRYAPKLNDFYWHELIDDIEPEPYVTELIQGLKERGIRLGVGTDMTAEWQIRKLEQLGLIDYMDFIVTSEEAGVEKPEYGVFRLAADKAGCELSECLFIGDNLKKDVQGALDAGMSALWYQPDTAKATNVSNVKSTPTYEGLIDHIFSM